MKLSDIKAKLIADSYSKKGDVITVRWEFFYTHGRTTADKEKAVHAAFPTAVIVESGEVWKPFRGGASTANSSHWFVKFYVPSPEPDEMAFGHDGSQIPEVGPGSRGWNPNGL